MDDPLKTSERVSSAPASNPKSSKVNPAPTGFLRSKSIGPPFWLPFSGSTTNGWG